jgi:hypothetical protein
VISPTLSVRAGGMFQDANVAGRNYVTDDRWGGFIATKWTPTNDIKITTNYVHTDLSGLPDFGTAQIDFNYAPQTTVQQALDTFQQSGEKTAIHYSLPNGGGERYVLGFIQQTGEQGQNGGLWTGSATFRATGAPVTVIS